MEFFQGKKNVEARSTSLERLFADVDQPSAAGVPVNAESALGYSPLWQAVDLISSDISRLPWRVYERVDGEYGQGKRLALDHPTHRLLSRNVGDMTTNLWLSRMVSHALLYGNGYSIIHRGAGGQVEQLQWVHSDSVEIKRENGKNVYAVRDEDGRAMPRVSEEDMFHLQGLVVGYGGGCSIVQYAATTLGKLLAAEEYSAEFFANGAMPSGFLSHPAALSEQARKTFLDGWQRRHSGRGHRHRVALLEENIQWVSMGVSPEDAMLLETASFGVREVARFFNLPPAKLGAEGTTAYASLEQENRSYHQSSLAKWVSRLEFEMTDKGFSDREKKEDRFFTHFDLDALLKAATLDRYSAHATAISWGIKSPNEVRAEENLDGYAGGELFMSPMNMTSSGDAVSSEAPDDIDEQADRLLARQTVLADAFSRTSTRLVNQATKAAKKPSEFLAFVNNVDGSRPDVDKILRPHLRMAVDPERATEIIGTYLAFFSDSLLRASECQPDKLSARVSHCEVELNEWVDQATTKLAREMR